MSSSRSVDRSGPIAWMASNSIATNLAMVVQVAGSVLVGWSRRSSEFALTRSVRPTGREREIEQGILLAIEDQIRGVDGEKLTSEPSRAWGP